VELQLGMPPRLEELRLELQVGSNTKTLWNMMGEQQSSGAHGAARSGVAAKLHVQGER